jgi:hypothetical protein
VRRILASVSLGKEVSVSSHLLLEGEVELEGGLGHALSHLPGKGLLGGLCHLEVSS